MNVDVGAIRALLGVVLLLLGVAACGANEDGSGTWKAGLEVSDEATAQGVGLPHYPGAKPYKDEHDDSNAADIGISTPLFGLKVVAVELETKDEPEKVAAFYRDALSKYGDVLECFEGKYRKGKDDSSARKGELECDQHEDGKHSIVYKVGTDNNQRIVAIEPLGSGTKFALAHVNIRDDSDE